MSDLYEARRLAGEIEAKAWDLVKAFDDKAEAMQPLDRRVPYAAFVVMMTSFIRSSPANAETVLSDFCARVMLGVDAPQATKQ